MPKEKVTRMADGTVTTLKRKKDGAFAVSSKSHVAVALRERERLQFVLDSLMQSDPIAGLRDDIAALDNAVNEYVIDHYEAGEGYEDDNYLATKVVGHRRSWDVEKLEKLIPRGIFKNVVEFKVIPDKIDEYVRKGKLDRKKIGVAFTETPNKPYVKVTKREQNEGKGEAEASGLAAKLS